MSRGIVGTRERTPRFQLEMPGRRNAGESASRISPHTPEMNAALRLPGITLVNHIRTRPERHQPRTRQPPRLVAIHDDAQHAVMQR